MFILPGFEIARKATNQTEDGLAARGVDSDEVEQAAEVADETGVEPEAGGELAWVYDPDPKKVTDFVTKYPSVKIARSLDEILADVLEATLSAA